MAVTTLGDLILNMRVNGDKTVVKAIQNVDNSIRNYNRSQSSTANSGSKLSNVLGGLSKKFAALLIVDSVSKSMSFFWDKLKQGIKSGMEYNSEIEYLNASIEALTGSQKVSNRLTKEMTILAAETPFQISHFAKASKTLLGYGINQKDVMKDMEMLGNISMGDAYKLDRLSLAFGQVAAKGKLQAEEVRQMVNQGFNPLMVISEKTGKSIATLTEEMKDGKISFDMVKESMQVATSKGGRFYNSMDKLSKTFRGQQEKIKEYGDIFWGNLIKPFQDVIASKIFPKVVNHLKNSGDNAKRLGNYLMGVAKKIYDFLKPYYDIAKPLVYQGLIKVRAKLSLIKQILPGIIEQIKRFVNAFKVGNFQYIEGILKKLFPKSLETSAVSFSKILQKVRDVVFRIVGSIITNFPKIIKTIQDFGSKAIPIISTLAIPIINRLAKAFSEIDIIETVRSFMNLGQSFVNLVVLLKPFLAIIAGALVVAFYALIGVISAVISGFDDFIRGFQFVVAIIVDLVTLILSLITGTSDDTMKILKKLGNDIVGAFVNLLNGALNIIANVVESIIDAFKSLYNILVGHSIIPDMVKAIVSWFKKLIGVPVQMVISLKDKAVSTFRSMYSYIKTTASNIYNYVKDKFRFVYNTTKDSFSFTYNTIKSKMALILSIIRSKINSVLSQFGEMKAKIMTKIKSIDLYKSGQNLINGFVRGIKSKIQSAKNAVSNVSQTVKDYLGWHSPTKKGAGSDSDKWIPNLMEMMLEGFDKYQRKLAVMSNNMAGIILQGNNPNAMGLTNAYNTTNTSTNNKNVNINIYATTDSIGKQLIAELNRAGVYTHK